MGECPRASTPGETTPRRLGEDGAQLGEACASQRVPGPVAALLRVDDARGGENPQMVADRRLADTDVLGDIADACRAVRARPQQRDDLQASGVGDRLEKDGELLGGLPIDGRAQSRGAALGSRGSSCGLQGRGGHKSILTDVDLVAKVLP